MVVQMMWENRRWVDTVDMLLDLEDRGHLGIREQAAVGRLVEGQVA